MTTKNLPSAFNPDQISSDPAETPSTVSRITAYVLGALITAQVLKLEEQPGETIELVDEIIAEAVNKALDDIDMPELQRAMKTRLDARRASRSASSTDAANLAE